MAHSGFAFAALNTIGVVLGVLIFAGIEGSLLRLVLRGIERRWIRWLLGTLASLLAVFVSGIVMLIWGVTTPAADEERFTSQRVIRLELPYKGGPPAVVEFHAPQFGRVDEDFQVDLFVTGVPSSASTPAVLSAGEDAHPRTATPCIQKSAGATPGAIEACGLPTNGATHFRWFLRSGAAGVSVATISLPIPQLGPEFWTANLTENGNPWYVRLQHTPTQSMTPAQSTMSKLHRDDYGGTFVPVDLAKNNPVVTHGGFEVDLTANHLTFPTEFDTTLGVSESTYSAIALVGTLLSALLGGGFLWPLLARRSQKAGKQHEPFRPGQRSKK
jgi:hypothetical protein